MKRAHATIEWKPPAESGRPYVPPGPQYTAPARFEVEDDRWPNEAWSLVARIDAPASNEYVWDATVWFLVPEAPQHWLKENNKFGFYEGKSCVATGTITRILDDNDTA